MRRTPLLFLYLFGCLVARFGEAEAAEPFKIGVIAPLSGFAAEYGTALKNGMEMARSEGKLGDVVLNYEDSEYDQKKTISAFIKLRNSGQADLIFNWGNNPSEALIPLAERGRFPIVALTLDDTSTKGKRYAVRFTNGNREFGRVAAGELQRRGVKRIAIVRTESNYLATMTDGLQAALAPEQTLEVVAVFQPDDNDVRSSVAKLKAKPFDIIGVFLSSGQIAQFYRLAKEQDLKTPTFGTDFFESGTEIAAAGEAINGAFYAHNEVRVGFRDAYVKRFGNDYQITTAGAGYDFAVMAGEVFGDSAGGKSADEIMKAIKTRGAGSGVLGARTFLESAEEGASFGFPIVIKEIREGKIVPLLKRD